MKVKKFIKIFINLFVAGLCVLFSVSESVDAGSTLPPFGYVTIVNENVAKKIILNLFCRGKTLRAYLNLPATACQPILIVTTISGMAVFLLWWFPIPVKNTALLNIRPRIIGYR